MGRRVFQQKVVVITGGCAGIGRALALRFAQAGAHIAILDIQDEALVAFRQQLHDKLNADVMALHCDVSDDQQCAEAISQVVERFGGIDLLINNAGITHRSAFADTDIAVFQRIMAVNYFGAVRYLPSHPCLTVALTMPANMRYTVCLKPCAWKCAVRVSTSCW